MRLKLPRVYILVLPAVVLEVALLLQLRNIPLGSDDALALALAAVGLAGRSRLAWVALIALSVVNVAVGASMAATAAPRILSGRPLLLVVFGVLAAVGLISVPMRRWLAKPSNPAASRGQVAA